MYAQSTVNSQQPTTIAARFCRPLSSSLSGSHILICQRRSPSMCMADIEFRGLRFAATSRGLSLPATATRGQLEPAPSPEVVQHDHRTPLQVRLPSSLSGLGTRRTPSGSRFQRRIPHRAFDYNFQLGRPSHDADLGASALRWSSPQGSI